MIFGKLSLSITMLGACALSANGARVGIYPHSEDCNEVPTKINVWKDTCRDRVPQFKSFKILYHDPGVVDQWIVPYRDAGSCTDRTATPQRVTEIGKCFKSVDAAGGGSSSIGSWQHPYGH